MIVHRLSGGKAGGGGRGSGGVGPSEDRRLEEGTVEG